MRLLAVLHSLPMWPSETFVSSMIRCSQSQFASPCFAFRSSPCPSQFVVFLRLPMVVMICSRWLLISPRHTLPTTLPSLALTGHFFPNHHMSLLSPACTALSRIRKREHVNYPVIIFPHMDFTTNVTYKVLLL